VYGNGPRSPDENITLSPGKTAEETATGENGPLLAGRAHHTTSVAPTGIWPIAKGVNPNPVALLARERKLNPRFLVRARMRLDRPHALIVSPLGPCNDHGSVNGPKRVLHCPHRYSAGRQRGCARWSLQQTSPKRHSFAPTGIWSTAKGVAQGGHCNKRRRNVALLVVLVVVVFVLLLGLTR